MAAESVGQEFDVAGGHGSHVDVWRWCAGRVDRVARSGDVCLFSREEEEEVVEGKAGVRSRVERVLLGGGGTFHMHPQMN